MLFKSIFSYIKDTVSINCSYKYKILEIREESLKDAVIKCETIMNGHIVLFSLHDIIYYDKLRFFALEDILSLLELRTKNPLSKSDPYISNGYKYYNILVLASVLCLLTSSFAATKICNIWGLEIDGGSVIFPISYIINDLITEKYGFKAARRGVLVALSSLFFVSSILYAVAYIPPSSGWNNHASFFNIFNLTPIIFIATLVSYFVGEMTNSFIMAKLKIKYNGSYFIGRAILSTSIGALIDTTLFCYIVFFNNLEVNQINQMILVLTSIKIGYEIVLMPFALKLLNILKKSAV